MCVSGSLVLRVLHSLCFTLHRGASTLMERRRRIIDALKSANETWMNTFARGDSAGMADLYTEDGQLLPAQSDVVSGRQAIEAFWQSVLDMGIETAKLETVEAEGHGDTAIEVGRYRLSSETGRVMDQGKYVVIWKQVDGQWKLHRDIWNTSQPA